MNKLSTATLETKVNEHNEIVKQQQAVQEERAKLDTQLTTLEQTRIRIYGQIEMLQELLQAEKETSKETPKEILEPKITKKSK